MRPAHTRTNIGPGLSANKKIQTLKRKLDDIKPSLKEL